VLLSVVEEFVVVAELPLSLSVLLLIVFLSVVVLSGTAVVVLSGTAVVVLSGTAVVVLSGTAVVKFVEVIVELVSAAS
jgi:hypothetical protein